MFSLAYQKRWRLQRHLLRFDQRVLNCHSLIVARPPRYYNFLIPQLSVVDN